MLSKDVERTFTKLMLIDLLNISTYTIPVKRAKIQSIKYSKPSTYDDLKEFSLRFGIGE